MIAMAVICAGSALLILILLRLKRVMSDLQSVNERAESSSRARSQFLAGMSHEMRTPLHGILSLAELGRLRAASLTPEKATRYYEMIGESGRRLMESLNDLVDLGSLEEGTRTLHFRSAPIETVVVGVMEELRPLFQSRGIGLEGTSCEPGCVWMDREAVQQLLRYVMTGAAGRSGPGGTVRVALVRSERGSLLTVTDHSSDRSQNVIGGSEVRLAICRHIISAHRGRLWTETRHDCGGAVYLEIPEASRIQGKPSIDPSMATPTRKQVS
jgi:signal transduction histidine kinase